MTHYRGYLNVWNKNGNASSGGSMNTLLQEQNVTEVNENCQNY